MTVYTLKYKQLIDSDIDTVFSFFSNAENLSKITPPKLKFKILTPLPIKMKEGQLIDYTIKILGKRIRWRTIITEFNPNIKFVDQQLNGPYSMWHHTHEFKEIDNKVEMIDKISYAIPFGFLGRIVNFIFVKGDLDEIFNYRYKVIEKLFNK
tara:strand:- start:79 stop:534 length:456 start_codon:yes stop_codon:yes gene_type:complete